MHAGSDGDTELPGEGLDPALMPGHWLLARLGKRVLRPGGRELTGWMIDRLGIGHGDDALEIAPGLGVTAEVALRHGPRTYVGVERDAAAAAALRARLEGPGRRILQGSAERIDLPAGAVTVAWAEAVLTMSPPAARVADRIPAPRPLRTAAAPDGDTVHHAARIGDVRRFLRPTASRRNRGSRRARDTRPGSCGRGRHQATTGGK